MVMGRSEMARLIHSEQVYQERIRQLEYAVAELKAKVQYYERILRQDVPALESGEILEADIVGCSPKGDSEVWTMYHDPDGNQYDSMG